MLSSREAMSLEQRVFKRHVCQSHNMLSQS